MTKYVFDNVSGQFWTDNPELVMADDPRAVFMTVPANTAAWRLRYNPETKKVDVKYKGMTDAEAEVQQDLDIKAEAERLAAERAAAQESAT